MHAYKKTDDIRRRWLQLKLTIFGLSRVPFCTARARSDADFVQSKRSIPSEIPRVRPAMKADDRHATVSA